ncbi:S16 family serine protease [Paenibacillus sp. Leaf72]|uniref:S16 family serine protease n=1 Tax=Paenibacillus sp. Leaf72 TaxID=1736234 RepID=UPI0006FC8756|nr:S16 family serine protease [Paenibacillus sp. Leaf72]KQN96773.1 hypothetical protein ASF12_22125 [Paenibacillus sp. Leaf72]
MDITSVITSSKNKINNKPQRRVFFRFSLVGLLILFIVFILSLIPIANPKIYELPDKLYPAQTMFKNVYDDGIFIPSSVDKKTDNILSYLHLRFFYDKEILRLFEKATVTTENHLNGFSPGHVYINSTEEGLLYSVLPAYIAGHKEAHVYKTFYYQYEIISTPIDNKELEWVSGYTIQKVDGHPININEINSLVKDREIHEIELKTIEGALTNVSTSLYGVNIKIHYSIDDLWRLNDMLHLDVAGVKGNSGGAATAYEVFLKAKSEYNQNGRFVITGTIDIEGNIGSVGSINAKTYLADQHGIPVMFVPNGENHKEALKMKEQLDSDIVIVPIHKLGDIAAYWRDLHNHSDN